MTQRVNIVATLAFLVLGNYVKFDNAVFGDGANLSKSVFAAWPSFVHTTFGKGVAFESSRFGRYAEVRIAVLVTTRFLWVRHSIVKLGSPRRNLGVELTSKVLYSWTK